MRDAKFLGEIEKSVNETDKTLEEEEEEKVKDIPLDSE